MNLTETFGDRFKVSFDHAYNRRGHRPNGDDPWLMMVECRLGSIYPQGGNTLAADVDGNHPGLRTKLVTMGFPLIRDADDGFTVLFDVADFDRIAAVMKPRRKRIATDTERERLKKVGFRKPHCESGKMTALGV